MVSRGFIVLKGGGRIVQCALVISSLKRGGAERVLVDLANGWAERGWPVTVVTVAARGIPPAYPVADAVQVVDVDVPLRPSSLVTTALGTWRRSLRLRRLVADLRPDVVVSFLVKVNVLTVLACRGLPPPVVVAEHNDPASQPIGPLWRRLRRLAYGRAARVVALTDRAFAALPPEARCRGVVIPNPLSPEFSAAADEPAVGPDEPVVVAMGRLTRQKGFDLLLRAFGRVRLDRPAWRLVVFGEGPERPALEGLRDELGLHDAVSLPGTTDDVLGAFRRAALLALPSRWEGLPRVVAEAMAAGLPVVAFDCRTGPAEMVDDGVTGRLVPSGDVEAFAGALAGLMDDGTERRRMGRAAQVACRRWSLPAVLDQWDELVFGPLGGSV